MEMTQEKEVKSIRPVLFSVPVIEKLDLPPRAEILPKIENGEIEYLDFTAKTFGMGRNYNPYRFKDEDLAAFALSFEGQPFLRNHDERDIEARDGTILESRFDGAWFVMTIRLTTRRGMIDFIEGRIDRFSIGWYFDDIECSICGKSWLSADCPHWPGVKYETPQGEQVCNLIFINPRGKEVSAVNSPAVMGTEIIPQLQELKMGMTPPPAPPQIPAERAGYLERVEGNSEEINGEVEITAADTQQETSAPEDGQAPVTGGIEAEEGTAQARQEFQKHRLAIAEQSIYPEGGSIMNLRELLSERAAKIARARELFNLADQEQRDFTEEEQAEFDAILGKGEAKGLLAELDEKIKKVQEERAKLEDAEASLEVKTQEPIKPEPVVNPLLKTRAEFQAMSPKERMAFSKAKGKLTD